MSNTFGKALMATVSADISSITKDLVEAGIDSITKDEFLKNIPVVNTVHSLIKIGTSIREQIFIRKIIKFIFQIREIPLEIRNEYINNLEEKDKRQEVGEKILVIIEKIDDIDKAEILGKLFRAHILGKFGPATFLRLSYIISNSYLHDLVLLKNGFDNEARVATYYFSQQSYDSFYRIGLASSKIIPDSSSIQQRERYGKNGPIDYKIEYKLKNDALIIAKEAFDLNWIESTYSIYHESNLE